VKGGADGMSEDARELWSVLRYVSALRATSEDLSRDLALRHGPDEVRAQLTGALVYLTRFARELERQKTRCD
jgi:hypothetical protein